VRVTGRISARFWCTSDLMQFCIKARCYETQACDADCQAKSFPHFCAWRCCRSCCCPCGCCCCCCCWPCCCCCQCRLQHKACELQGLSGREEELKERHNDLNAFIEVGGGAAGLEECCATTVCAGLQLAGDGSSSGMQAAVKAYMQPLPIHTDSPGHVLALRVAGGCRMPSTCSHPAVRVCGFWRLNAVNLCSSA
jgi:hypothetical protein